MNAMRKRMGGSGVPHAFHNPIALVFASTLRMMGRHADSRTAEEEKP
jgi:hypothetical protein